MTSTVFQYPDRTLRVELKNIKHSEFASEETHCYQASLYIDNDMPVAEALVAMGGSLMDQNTYLTFCATINMQADDWNRSRFDVERFAALYALRGVVETMIEEFNLHPGKTMELCGLEGIDQRVAA